MENISHSRDYATTLVKFRPSTDAPSLRFPEPAKLLSKVKAKFKSINSIKLQEEKSFFELDKLRPKAYHKMSWCALYSKKFKIRAIKHQIRQLKNQRALTSISLSNQGCSDQGVRIIALNLKHLNFLSGITLDLSGSVKMTNGSMKNLAYCFKEHSSLTSLNINLFGCREISEGGFKALFSAFKYLKLLSDLTLYFVWFKKLSDNDLIYLSTVFRYIKSLETLSLYFNLCPQITSKGLCKVFESLHNFNKLSTLRLSLAALDIQGPEAEKCMTSLGVALQSLKALKVVEISFHEYNHMNCEAFEGLCKGLETLTSLHSLKLKLTDCSMIQEEGMKSFYRVLTHQQNLFELCLGLGGCISINDEQIEMLNRSLLGLTNLRRLEINLSSLPHISDKSIESQSRTFKQLENLNDLKLAYFDDKISDVAIENLKHNLKHINVSVNNYDMF